MSIDHGPLDELREAVVSSADLSTKAVDAVHDLIDAFEAAHPGLVDKTTHCIACGKPVDSATCLVIYNINDEIVGDICSTCAAACAKEAE